MNIINPHVKVCSLSYQGIIAPKNVNAKAVTDNNKKLENDMSKMSELGKTQINFKGKFKLNKTDLAFLGTLAATLGLSLEHFDRMKNTVSDFLKTNGMTSMDDLRGEENLEKQCQLTEKINEDLQLDDEGLDLLVTKVIERCENQFGYDEDELMLYNIERAIKTGLNKQKDNDEKFINALVTVLGLSREQETVLRKIIDENLKENNLISLQRLGENEDNISAVIAEQIEKQLHLTENEGLLVAMELVNRSAMGDNYEPQITPLDLNTEICHRDSVAYNDVIRKYTDSIPHIEKLHLAMKHDAAKVNYDSIFKLFDSNSNFDHLRETNTVLDSMISGDEKFDFIMDMYLAAQNLESVQTKLMTENDEVSDNIFKQYATVCFLDDEYNLSERDLRNLKKYLRTQKVNFEDKKSIYKIAYELTENDSFPRFTFDKIVEIMNRANNIPHEELLQYNFLYCQKIMDKR